MFSNVVFSVEQFTLWGPEFKQLRWKNHSVTTPTPFSTRSDAGKNHLNEEITPLLPTEIDEQYCQTISNFGHAALLRQCEFPL